MTPGATPPCTCVCTHIECASLIPVAQPTAHARQRFASQDFGLPLPPRCLPRRPHTAKRILLKSSAHPEVSTISYNTPFSLQQLTTQRPYPGSAGLHHDPWCDSSVYVRIYIYRVCLTDICSLTHSPRATAIGFAGPRTSSSSLPPSSLPPHIQTYILKALYIPRGKYNIIQHVFQRPTAYNSMTLPRLHPTMGTPPCTYDLYKCIII